MLGAVAVLVLNLGAACCVPPTVVFGGSGEGVHSEIKAVKNTLKILSEQWERWNTLFLTSLEPRITNTASTLASIDSNIHNLQERAHAWDTFQLHVSAWNEQLATLDRKMDILSKGQEEILGYSHKVNSIGTLEYKLDNAIKQLLKIEDAITENAESIQSKSIRYSHVDPLFGEFASRGILSSIKMVEKKLDRLLISNQNMIVKSKLTNKDENSKLTIKCNTPKYVEDLLNDISSKVDVLYDSLNSNESYEETDEDYIDVKSEGSGEEIVSTTPKIISPSNLKARMKKRALKIMHARQNNKDIEEILSRVIRIENSSLIMLDRETTNYENILQHIKQTQSCSLDFKPLYEHIYNYSIDNTKNMNLILESYFNEQRAHISTMLDQFSRTCYLKNLNSDSVLITPSTSTSIPQSDDTTEEITTTEIINNDATVSIPSITELNTETTPEESTTIVSECYNTIKLSNISSCEDLESDSESGVYIFENITENEDTSQFYNKRYCEIRTDGLWTVIQRRDNYTVQENFNVSWDSYKYGFGDMKKDFWIGNNLLHKLTNKYHLLLRIELEDFDGNTAWAEYSRFRVAAESDNFKIIISGYNGNASDSFSSHNGSLFSTFDRKNDDAPECCSCAVSYGGGWWFNRCFEANLNGVYYKKPNENIYFRGIIWEHWLGNYSLKKSIMMVKPRGELYTPTDIPFYDDP